MFPLNMRRSVAQLKTRTRTGSKPPYYVGPYSGGVTEGVIN